MRIEISKGAITRKVLNDIERLPKNIAKGLADGFEEMGAGLVRTLRNSILNEPKYGREYRIKQGGVRRLHRASAPKQTPALITGEYDKATFYKPHGKRGLTFGNTAPYAADLELGRPNMEARPGLLNAITASIRNSRLYLENNLDKNIRQ